MEPDFTKLSQDMLRLSLEHQRVLPSTRSILGVWKAEEKVVKVAWSKTSKFLQTCGFEKKGNLSIFFLSTVRHPLSQAP